MIHPKNRLTATRDQTGARLIDAIQQDLGKFEDILQVSVIGVSPQPA